MSADGRSSFTSTRAREVTADDLVEELRHGWIHAVAFVVLGEPRWTLPLYELALATARGGWSIGIEDARYWLVTPEPVPLAGCGAGERAAIGERLEPEGITFIGSTFADLEPGVVTLDPQGEILEVDRVITLSDDEAPRADQPAGGRREAPASLRS